MTKLIEASAPATSSAPPVGAAQPVLARNGLGLYTSPAGQLQLAEIAERHGWREMAATLRRIARGEEAL